VVNYFFFFESGKEDKAFKRRKKLLI
jgi:hypothetical protein